MAVLTVLVLGAAIVGLLTIDFDEGDNVATGPGATSTTEVPASTVPGGGTTATTGGPSGTTATTGATATTQASSQGTTATTSAPATTQATTATTAATTATTSGVGGSTATTAPGSGLSSSGSGQAGQEPLATSGGTDMLIPAIGVALLGVFGWRLSRRSAPAQG